ncbi:MAG: alpha/beta fold hydrolase, partial [Syntrophales bacterium]
SLHVDDGGSGGVAVVFVHAFGGNTTHWSAQLEHLRQKKRAVALDLRGHGLSQPPADGDYRMESLAGDIDAVVNKISLQRFVLVGHSMGGSVVIEYASLHPERVAGLVLVDTGNPKEIPEGQKQQYIRALESDAYAGVMESYFEEILVGSGPGVREKIMGEIRNMPKEVAVQLVKEQLRFDPVSALSGYHGPRLAVVTPANEMPYSLHNLLPDFPHVVMTGTSHWLQLDKPQEFNRILDEFLDKVGTHT